MGTVRALSPAHFKTLVRGMKAVFVCLLLQRSTDVPILHKGEDSPVLIRYAKILYLHVAHIAHRNVEFRTISRHNIPNLLHLCRSIVLNFHGDVDGVDLFFRKASVKIGTANKQQCQQNKSFANPSHNASNIVSLRSSCSRKKSASDAILPDAPIDETTDYIHDPLDREY